MKTNPRRKFLNQVSLMAAVSAFFKPLSAIASINRTNKMNTRAKTGCPVVHFEIGCSDTEKTNAFYTAIFGWSGNPTPMASYLNTNSEKGVQGHITNLGHEPRHYVNIYIEVDDIKAYLEKIEKAGGKKVVGPVPLPDGKKFAWFSDLDGNIIGLLSN